MRHSEERLIPLRERLAAMDICVVVTLRVLALGSEGANPRYVR